ncbi:MAG TPA: anthranilate synthase component I family protein [Polyangiaceae bacterium]|nr:anthranilate synthase component I family protein [Polyangiaceae bacterium]
MPRLYRCSPDLPPDGLRLARSISGEPGAFLLRSSAFRELTIIGAWPLEYTNALYPDRPATIQIEDTAESPPQWIGLLPYDAFRALERGNEISDPRPPSMLPRCEWWRYGAVAVIRDRVEILGDDQRAVNRLARRLSAEHHPESVRLRYLGASESERVHASRVSRVLEAISRGELYQVNLARTFNFNACGSPIGLFQRLFQHSKVPFGFAIDAGKGRAVVGASPELCLEICPDGRLLARPIKGTRPRGDSAAEDAERLQELCTDPKELAELNMVIDLVRNDLARVSETGTVAVISSGESESFEAVHHRVATVCAQMRPSVSTPDALRAFLPSASVTGAPKIAAMQMIGQLETNRRGLYTGAFGCVCFDGSVRLAMAIRTLVVDSTGAGQYHSGGGIVADSDPGQEVQETRWKAHQLLFANATAEQPPRSEGLPSSRPPAKNWADWMGSGIEA